MYFEDLRQMKLLWRALLANNHRYKEQVRGVNLASGVMNIHQNFKVKLGTSLNLSQVRKLCTCGQHACMSPCTPDCRNNISPLPPPRCSSLEGIFHPSSLTVQLLKAISEWQTMMIREKGENRKEVSLEIPVIIQKA